ncbi:MAG: hypothetical protein M9944_03705 [Rhizobiaceae bacterium]|nr:hypothetical protein [Rhizobiaceae bacterium]
MELTISQIASAMSQWVARQVPTVQPGMRTAAAGTSEAVDTVPPAASATIGDLDTEYDQFGRFGVSASTIAAPAEDRTRSGTGVNPTKHFRSGKVSVLELDQEYARSLAASASGEHNGADRRRFIPSGMTEYQVRQLYDFQYRWAIEVERQAIARNQGHERPAVPVQRPAP